MGWIKGRSPSSKRCAAPVWTAYILVCANGALYTGMTSNLDRRLDEHFSGRGGPYTQTCKPIQFLWCESHRDRFAAAKRERQVNGWTRRKKLALVRGDFELLKKF